MEITIKKVCRLKSVEASLYIAYDGFNVLATFKRDVGINYDWRFFTDSIYSVEAVLDAVSVFNFKGK